MINDDLVRSVTGFAQHHIATAQDKDRAVNELLVDVHSMVYALRDGDTHPTTIGLATAATWEEIARQVEALRPSSTPPSV